MQFRGIVRQHIESFSSTGPTVVHCSAGVDRTGVFIALDTVLQQLEKEKGISIAACVHRMRLNRPLMVQTEVHHKIMNKKYFCFIESFISKETLT
uniref:protein-tyrosine-phosphatase n=1 Tax=Astyanax mexicanus TaxID=7994 RepID=A0A3B1IQY6_ASTMX